MVNLVSDMLADEPAARSPKGVGPRRLVDGFDPRLVNLLTIVGFGVPIAAYVWFLHRYSLNVITGDQWDDVNVIIHSYKHVFDWSSLWSQHNENRIFFPNLIVLALAYTTHFNIQVEEYLSAILLVASAALLTWAHKRRSPSTPWLYYCPVVILMLSFVEFGDTLFGFQLAWFLVLFAVAVTFIVLDRPVLTQWWLAVGIAAAVVASYSSLQGLIVWPTGLLLLYYRRRPMSFTIVWVAAAAVTVAVYFTDYVSPVNPAAIRHPLAGIEFFLVIIGDIVGLPVSGRNATGIAVLVLGLIIAVVAIWVLVLYCRRRDTESGNPIAAALICFGLLFAASVTIGRISQGWPGASQSRYRMFDMLMLVGLYLAVLDQRALRWRASEKHQPAERPHGPDSCE